MITKKEALERAIKNLEYVDETRYNGYGDPSKALGLIAQAKAEAAKVYLELFKMLDG